MTDKKEETKINWSNLAFALGAFGLTSGTGFAVTAMTKADKTTQLAGACVPAIGAGIIAYYARKICPGTKPAVERATFVTRRLPVPQETRPQSALIGYGYVSPSIATSLQRESLQSESFRQEPVIYDTQWVPNTKELLRRLGYYTATPTESSMGRYLGETGPDFNLAVARFQKDMNLTPTGWIDNQTAAKLSEATGEPVTTITPRGVGVSVDNPSVKKEGTNWALWLGIGAGALILGGVIVYSAKKK